MARYIGLALGVKLEVWREMMSTGKESGGYEESFEKKYSYFVLPLDRN